MLPIASVARRSAAALALVSYLLFSTGCQPPETLPPPPVLLIIGVDNSQSFRGHNKIEIADIEGICSMLSESGRGGTVVFQMIGRPTSKSPLRVEFEPFDNDCGQYPATQARKCRESKKALVESQKSEIQQFLSRCQQELAKPFEEDTDLNGFFSYAQTLTEEPQLEEHRKFMFLYSDGYHDVRTKTSRDKTLDCTLLPPKKAMNSAVCGWKNPEACSFGSRFADPAGFKNYFKKAINGH